MLLIQTGCSAAPLNVRMNDLVRERSQPHILIVDDFPDNVELLAFLLSQRGYTTTHAASGQAALHSIEQKLPDLILLDIRMPEMDGYEVCTQLKANARTQDIPVIFLSASDETFNKVQAFNLGGVDYITKPFHVEEALARVENQLTIRRQQVQLESEIQERQRIEATLFESRSLLASVLNSSLDGIGAFQSIRNAEGEIVDFRWILANQVIANLANTHAETLVGKSLRDCVQLEQFERLFPCFKAVVTTQRALKREFRYDSECQSLWFQIVAVQLGDGLAVNFRDITDRKEMELALQDANQTLKRLAILDSLTQVANRRRFDQYFEREWQYAFRHQQSLALILCDIDYFKRYNDYYGHQAGDRCLQQVAGAMRSAVKRSIDLVARYGGEEFAVVLPNTQVEGALQVAEEIRAAVKQLNLRHEDSFVSDRITLSLGVSSAIPQAKHQPAVAIATADRALYIAKTSGRDRVIYQDIDP
jgi:two-component system cell cycle response regulator